MTESMKEDLRDLCEALQEVGYGVMLQVGQATATKLISAAAKVAAQTYEEPSVTE